MPAPEEQLPGRFTARVAVSGFTLQGPQAGRAPRSGYGHLAFALDRGRYDEPRYSGRNGRLALALAVNGYYSPAYATAITYQHIPAGSHSLSVQLINRNDTPTGVGATVSFKVR